MKKESQNDELPRPDQVREQIIRQIEQIEDLRLLQIIERLSEMYANWKT